MTSEQITCPRCGEPATLYISSNSNFLAVHGANPPMERIGSFEYPPFVNDRQTAINRMVTCYTGVSPGSCPQAWRYDPIEDGEPDTVT